MRLKVFLLLIWNFWARTSSAQDVWIDPFFTLTQEAADRGATFNKPGEVRFTVFVPERPQIDSQFELGTFNISGGEKKKLTFQLMINRFISLIRSR